MNTPLWSPTPESVETSAIARLCRVFDLPPSFEALHAFSVEHPGAFWAQWLKSAGIDTQGSDQPDLVHSADMVSADWFPNLTLNFAAACLSAKHDAPAFVEFKENGERRELSRATLRGQVGALSNWLRAQGVVPGDVVAGFLPNGGDAVLAMLATAAVGAIWTSCSPDFGTSGVLDRFGQTQPKVLFCVDGYDYNGKTHDGWGKIQRIASELPGLQALVCVHYTGTAPALSASSVPAVALSELIATPCEPEFTPMGFRDPLFILYSSGTTGAPKCIIHSTGGTLAQLTKEHQLHVGIEPGDRLFYYTTLGWMMWNWLVSGLASGATLMLFDGSPFYPTADSLVTLAEDEGFSVFGTSAKYLAALEKAGVVPQSLGQFSDLKAVLSTGSPLSHESFEYVYRDWKADLLLGSISGGTDIVSCFVLSDPTSPVYAGQIQRAGLGMDVQIVDEQGARLGATDGKGELICATPFPSMPIGFWNDPTGERYRAAYFDRFPGIWAHGDYAEQTTEGGYIIHGRSDATLNPGGVRIGTAEIYRQVERVASVTDCLAIGQRWDDDVRVVLFVVLRDGVQLDDALQATLRTEIRTHTTPRHVPARIVQVPELPRTRSGKLVELAVRSVVHNEPVANTEALANPGALEYFKNLDALKN